MSRSRLTRIAPTPSGYLHLGNAVNFALISLLAQRWDAQVALRIDDMDATRCRPEYARDIFEILAWLEIPWTIGPRDLGDLQAHYSMDSRTDYYRSQLDLLDSTGLEVFACSCSRADLAGSGGLRCSSDCLHAGRELIAEESALRVRIPDGTLVTMGDRSIDIGRAHGDVILWRRDGLPAYHLVTVIEDRDLGVTDIVRGADLLESSALHSWLAPHLDAPNVAEANYVHHSLVLGDSGAKLSKTGRESGPLSRTAAARADARALAAAQLEALVY